MPRSFHFLAACALALMSDIVSAQSSGTAFVVAPGLLVTNHHVIEGCSAIEVIASDGRRPATVIDSVQQIDLALLRVYGLRGGVAALRTQSPALLGESATVFGFPLGGALSSTGNFTTGVVSSLRGLRDAAGEIQITAPVQPGNSGGPVLDRAGSVIGVVQGKLNALRVVRATGDIPQNVNFAVSLDVLADFLAKNSVTFKAVNRQPAIETTQVAEMAQTFTYKISCTAASRTATAPRPQPAPTAPNDPTPDKLVQDIQVALNQKGFNAGPADGFIGPQTQAAIVAAQRALGATATGVPSSELIAALKGLPTVAATSSISTALADLTDARAEFDQKNYASALSIWTRLAQSGNAEAQNNLGFMHLKGVYVTMNYFEAIKWFRLAASKGYAAAQNNLGFVYENGLGLAIDYAEAAKWYKLAARQGYAGAQGHLDRLYRAGRVTQ
jgi:peptidoglycan hydrolase-like protein with peptidoglycan-binding domain